MRRSAIRPLPARRAPAAGPRDRRAQRGQGLVEYGLMLMLIGIVAISALLYFGGNVQDTLSSVGASIGSPGGNQGPWHHRCDHCDQRDGGGGSGGG